MTNTIDFATLFSAGCYGGLVCCMMSVVANALYTAVRRRGTTRQLASIIVLCVICALLLLPAVVWYNIRFSDAQTLLPMAEVQVALIYVVLCGWFLPLSVTLSYYLFTSPRLLTISAEIPLQKRRTLSNPTTALEPHLRTGVPAPFVFDEDTPWGWLEHRSGRLKGQRLALKRAVITIGRDEDNDIWIDDEMSSRRHAELSWNEGTIYLTDCDSLNGVLLNGKRINGTVAIEPDNHFEIGSHRFLFTLAEKPDSSWEAIDPLNQHTWRSSEDLFTASSRVLAAATRNVQDKEAIEKIPTTSLSDSISTTLESGTEKWQATESLFRATPLPQPLEHYGRLVGRNGEMSGKTIELDRPILLLGRGDECSIVVHDASISRQHAQFSRQAVGDFVQDLTSLNGTFVNDEPLPRPRLLRTGDVILLGNILFEYYAAQHAQLARQAPFPDTVTPKTFDRSISGPVPLRLPSKQKENTEFGKES